MSDDQEVGAPLDAPVEQPPGPTEADALAMAEQARILLAGHRVSRGDALLAELQALDIKGLATRLREFAGLMPEGAPRRAGVELTSKYLDAILPGIALETKGARAVVAAAEAAAAEQAPSETDA